jgi:hypothetical protein
MHKMIRGKYDSLWKQEFNVSTAKFTGRLKKGFFDTAMNYARKNKGGVVAIRHIRNQPWESWRPVTENRQ